MATYKDMCWNLIKQCKPGTEFRSSSFPNNTDMKGRLVDCYYQLLNDGKLVRKDRGVYIVATNEEAKSPVSDEDDVDMRIWNDVKRLAAEIASLKVAVIP